MGTITSGVGLISGINTGQLIDSLIAIEARPQTLVKNRNTELTAQQVAFQDISAKLLAFKLTADSLAKATTFNANTTTSSDPSVVTATSAASASPGVYNFTVSRLVSSQQVITRGFTDTDSTAVGAGSLSFEFGDSHLDADTSLTRLNGGAGVNRGRIRITDRSGASTVVDLSKALTIGDVLDSINSASGINVTASVDGDGLKLTDNTGQVASVLAVSNVGTTATATGLGLTQASVGATISGRTINTVGASTLLSDLNDGNGVRLAAAGDDLTINRRDGTSFNVNLSGSTKLSDVISKINAASGGNVTASINSQGNGLQLVDATVGGTAFSVAAVGASNAAADLGILGSAAGGGAQIDGSRLIAGLNTRLLKNLHGGTGVSLGTIRITNRSGSPATDVDLSGATSVADVISRINAAGAGVTASVNNAGNGISLADTTGSTAANLQVADVSGTAAASLGLTANVASSTVNSGNLQFRYISEATKLQTLNGGGGVARGTFNITDSRGVSVDVDLTSTAINSVQDVLDNINSRGLGIHARINDHGDGILIEDTAAGGSAIKITEKGSSTAADLGLLGSATAAGQALDGSFEKSITLTGSETLSDLVTTINAAGLKVKASVINDGSASSPFRLALQGTEGGKAGAFVFDDGGLDFQGNTLAKAQDAVVFYGSTDPAKAVAITSTTNTLTSLIPSATVTLVSASDSPVSVNISRDDAALSTTLKQFTTSFNSVISTLDKYDTYNADTQKAGVLLGDATVSTIRSSLYRLVNNRNNEVQTQFHSFAEIGIKVSSKSTISLDDTKLSAAIAKDRDALVNLFTYKTTATDSDNVTTTTAGGIGVRMSELLTNLTDSTKGTLQTQLDAISKQIDLNTKTIAQYDVSLAAKKLILQTKFNAMETALAQLQSQGNALAGLSGLVTSSTKSNSSNSSSSSN